MLTRIRSNPGWIALGIVVAVCLVLIVYALLNAFGGHGHKNGIDRGYQTARNSSWISAGVAG
jgi:hypothetical protein